MRDAKIDIAITSYKLATYRTPIRLDSCDFWGKLDIFGAGFFTGWGLDFTLDAYVPPGPYIITTMSPGGTRSTLASPAPLMRPCNSRTDTGIRARRSTTQPGGILERPRSRCHHARPARHVLRLLLQLERPALRGQGVRQPDPHRRPLAPPKRFPRPHRSPSSLPSPSNPHSVSSTEVRLASIPLPKTRIAASAQMLAVKETVTFGVASHAGTGSMQVRRNNHQEKRRRRWDGSMWRFRE
jgi:hypothetical protein